MLESLIAKCVLVERYNCGQSYLVVGGVRVGLWRDRDADKLVADIRTGLYRSIRGGWARVVGRSDFASGEYRAMKERPTLPSV